MGWTPLHLACYFGHAIVVEDLLKVLASVGRKIFVMLEAVSIYLGSCDGRKVAL